MKKLIIALLLLAANATAGTITAFPVTTVDLTPTLAAKAPIASPTFTGTVSGITSTMVGLGNVDNTADSAKPISTAQQTALDGKEPTLGFTPVNTTDSRLADARTPLAHNQTISTVTGLQTALDDKADLATPLTAQTCSGTLAAISAANPFQTVTLTAACITTAWTFPTSGARRIVALVIQDATGSRTMTWPTGTKWPGGTAPTLTTAANSVDAVSCLLTTTSAYCAAAADFK